MVVPKDIAIKYFLLYKLFTSLKVRSHFANTILVGAHTHCKVQQNCKLVSQGTRYDVISSG